MSRILFWCTWAGNSMSFWFSWCTWMQTYVNTTTIHYTYISLCFTYYFNIHHAYIYIYITYVYILYIYIYFYLYICIQACVYIYIYIFNPLSQANLAASSGQDDPTLGMDQVWRRWQASVNPKKIRFQVLAIKWLTKIGHFWCNLSVNFLKKTVGLRKKKVKRGVAYSSTWNRWCGFNCHTVFGRLFAKNLWGF